MQQSDIILSTFNARYTHASLGLRYLLANMGRLHSQTELLEFTIALGPEEAVERLLLRQPKIIGFGVYIWNADKTLETIQTLKAVAPEVQVVIGGPEVSYEIDQQSICALADYVVIGAADFRFAQLCQDLLSDSKPASRIVSSLPIALETLTSPYSHYSDSDIKNRIIYVEASRGCPFKCEFCLSSLDKTATPFPLDAFLQDMQDLYQRGARHFKFVDRTFNLKVESCIRILDFFLALDNEDLFLHFELIPDRLPSRLKEKISAFPAACLQFEIGIQSFNPDVQAAISRRQNMQKTIENMQWLKQHCQAHIHADLIFGLPGETLESFASGFDQLVELAPQEIQLGILKRLRGTPIDRHTAKHGFVYQGQAPYRLLKNDLLDFTTVQRVTRFARYWDLIANSGRFGHSLAYLLEDTPFNNFLSLSDWLFNETGQTHQIALPRLFKLLAQWFQREAEKTRNTNMPTALSALAIDCEQAGYDRNLLVTKNSKPAVKKLAKQCTTNVQRADVQKADVQKADLPEGGTRTSAVATNPAYSTHIKIQDAGSVTKSAPHSARQQRHKTSQ